MSRDSPTSLHCYQITCSLTIQALNSTHVDGNKKTHKNAILTLGRNEFRDILIQISLGPKVRPVSYPLKGIKVHYRFANEGKGSIQIPSKNIQLLFSNCPPERLKIFLKTLEAKMTLSKAELNKTPLSNRKRLLSDLPEIFEKLSPLSLAEIKKLRPTLVDRTNKPATGKSPIISAASNKTPIRKGCPPKGRLNQAKVVSKSAVTPKARSSAVSSPKTTIMIQSEAVFLTEEQKRVIRAVLDKKSIFFTGSAGTGKSLVLKRLIGSLPHETTFITAATGVAACQIGGTTLHSFAGVGNGLSAMEHCIQLALRPAVSAQWRKCSHLIIDEISMIDGHFFTKLEKVARNVRRSTKPFGGIQLILCGDFCQLPPVTKKGEEKKFCFQSPAWNRCVEKTISLTSVKRQEDPAFIGVLQDVRFGRLSGEAYTVLEQTKYNEVDKDGVLATRLCTHKADADMINQSHMNELEGEEKIFRASDSEELPAAAGELLCPKELTLKSGSQVMLTKNLDFKKNLCNGSRGVVREFKNGFPVVKFVSGYLELIRPARFHIKLSGNRNTVIRTQIPLQLAWAISIHKSQGMSLDCVEMSLSRVFEDGQAYVALSRARSLKGLRIMDMDIGCVRANKDVLDFYQRMESNDGEIGDENYEEAGIPLKRQRLVQQFR